MSGVGWTKGRWERAFLAEAAVHPGSGAGRSFCAFAKPRDSVLRGVSECVYGCMHWSVCIGCVYLHVRQVCVYTGSVGVTYV